MTLEDWKRHLSRYVTKDFWLRSDAFLEEVYATGTVYPTRDKVFAAFDMTPVHAVRVIILGQDPYHGDGQAQGLSFSVPEAIVTPPSLRNILKELSEDIGERPCHDLTSWASQGVLLLNACLTVPKGVANGHQGLIWEELTDAVFSLLNHEDRPLVFILWGSFAQAKRSLLDNPRHMVLTASHPSPLSAYRGFFGSRPFSQANQFLLENGEETIDWLQ